jgi:hypothetical protein
MSMLKLRSKNFGGNVQKLFKIVGRNVYKFLEIIGENV